MSKYKKSFISLACVFCSNITAVYATQMEDGYTWTASDNTGNNFFIHYPSIQFDAINPNLVYAWFKYIPASSKGYTQTRQIIDCSNLLSAVTNIIAFDRFGKAISRVQTPIQFVATNPNSVGEMGYKAACTHKAYLQRVVP
ncbi:hypothetical protein [Hydromonas duriensis]|uniref:Uncharacterized protein n=1 Tax=Hydromonas duriensis TaxID=1527608 RepID=A0A4R6YAB9_9BURK|nr:hypothetical protein [Hydromonas duriensis]TDR32510.1 hypothetical protein DFR44_10323 [Hydromonas duriensis]